LTADDFRIVRVRHEGQTYTPVITRGGQVLDPGAVGALAHTRQAPRSVRWITGIIADESLPISGGATLQLASFRHEEIVPLELGDSELEIGAMLVIEPRPPQTMPATIGWSLVGTARLADTVLAAITWRAMRDGIITGFCVHFDCRATATNALDGKVGAVRLGAAEDSHLRGARILRAWETQVGAQRGVTAGAMP